MKFVMKLVKFVMKKEAKGLGIGRDIACMKFVTKKEANGPGIGRDNSYEICHEKRSKRSQYWKR